jgi:pantetheine-phosphate adenylyltransferase
MKKSIKILASELSLKPKTILLFLKSKGYKKLSIESILDDTQTSLVYDAFSRDKNKNSRIAVFVGSFDPFTVGHEAIVRRALSLFDKIIIGIGYNVNKKNFFPVEKRIKWIRQTFKDIPDRIEIMEYEGLTVDFAREVGAKYILRGIRTSSDFEYERAISQANKMLAPEIESVFLLTLPEHTPITSTIVRDILKHGGDASKFLPYKVKKEDLSK